MTDIAIDFDLWKTHAINHAFGLGLAPPACPDILPTPGRRDDYLIESMTGLPEALMDAICGKASDRFSWLLLQRDFLIRGTSSFVSGILPEDAEAIWRFMLGEAMGLTEKALSLPSGLTYPELDSLANVRLMYDKLRRCTRGRFNHLSI